MSLYFYLDTIKLKVELILLELNSKQENPLKNAIREQKFVGEIKMNNVNISLEQFDSNNQLLYPTQIVIKFKSESFSVDFQPITELDILMDNCSINLSQNYCKTLLSILNDYSELFETTTCNASSKCQ